MRRRGPRGGRARPFGANGAVDRVRFATSFTASALRGCIPLAPVGAVLFFLLVTTELCGRTECSPGSSAAPAFFAGPRGLVAADLEDAFFRGRTGVVVGHGGTILRTTDDGDEWSSVDSGTTESLLAVDFADENVGLVVGHRGTILRTTDGGMSWTPCASGTEDRLQDVAWIDGEKAVAVGHGGVIVRTDDGGLTWTRRKSGTSDVLFKVAFVDAQVGFAVGAFGTMIRTKDGGVGWEKLESDVGAALRGLCFNASGSLVVVGDDGTVFVSMRPAGGGDRETR